MVLVWTFFQIPPVFWLITPPAGILTVFITAATSVGYLVHCTWLHKDYGAGVKNFRDNILNRRFYADI